VPRLGAVAAGELLLARTARRVSARLRRSAPVLHVLANGGNFATDDANWVHSVHHAWPANDGVALGRHRVKRSIERRMFRTREARAFGRARLLVANSRRTRQDLLDHFPLDPAHVHVVPPGVESAWRPPVPEECRDARLRFGITGTAVLFVGALGADDNKGLGPLLGAWRALCAGGDWQATLVVAGQGALLGHWQRFTREAGLDQHVRFLGFVPDVGRAMIATDVLVSASRYESYGLAIAEALCRGVPAILPADAGIASSLGPAYAELLVRGVPDEGALVAALRRWAADPGRWRAVASVEGAKLREYTLEDMAADIVRVVET
jgi:glycosyltransferase involved in cell wall biosynthesis